MTPDEYVQLVGRIESKIEGLHNQLAMAYNDVDITPPDNLRAATAADIVLNRVIWHLHGDFGAYWNFVRDVLHPSDAFKAYVADDGCRYGLHDAWVQRETTP